MNSEKLFEKFKMHEKEEKERLTLTIIEQKETIEFYQNDLLRNLFEKSKNQTATYKNEKNETLNLKIVDIKDIFTIITSAYKIENDETDTNAICTI